MDISGAEESDEENEDNKSQLSGVSVTAAKSNAMANRSAANFLLLDNIRP